MRYIRNKYSQTLATIRRMKKLKFIVILIWIPFLSYSQNESQPDIEAYFSAMIVNDIETSINWYSNVMGFIVLDKTESQERGFIQSNLKRENILIELIELEFAVTAKDVVPNYNEKTRIVGFFKTGFLVSDFDKWINHLTNQKVNFHGNVIADNISGKRMIIIKDPDGNRIQIFEK